MKKVLLLAFICVSGLLTAQRCRVPVSNETFQQNFNQIAILRGDASKQVKAEQFVAANCVSSLQLKTLAQLFSTDSVRLIVCQRAYPQVTDPAGFFVVYDAFTTFSWALRLYDYTQHYTAPVGAVPTATVIATQPTAGPTYPTWFYPDTLRITGSRGCAGPVIAEHQFTTIANNVFRQPTEEAKIVAIENAMTAHCMSVSQHMKLASMLTSEDNRMRVMKNGFARVYDQEHYSYAGSMFSVPAKKDEWNNYCSAYLTPPCTVSAQDFNGLLQQVQAKNFDDDQLTLVKTLAGSRCFSVDQLKTFSNEFGFDEEKMEMFKYCYAKCPDKQNYYLLADKLTFTANKEELRRFINAGGH
jgi:hypothetical protein